MQNIQSSQNGTPATNGTHGYSVPEQADALFRNGILGNELIRKYLPAEAEDCARNITFEGSDDPSLPVNWRFAESVSSLKAYEATIVKVLLKRKYGIDKAPPVVINTDHASLFIMSSLLWTIDPNGEKLTGGSMLDPVAREKLHGYFPNWDIHASNSSHHRGAATNIYKCKDGRYFHLHGSMNPDPTLASVGFPEQKDAATFDDAIIPFKEKLSQITSDEMQHVATDKFRQAGTICWTTDEFKASEHGKANAHVGLFEIHSHENAEQPPCWWPEVPTTSASRPLAGLKVVDLTRVIAAPAVSRGLAEYGASVMRIISPNICDISALHVDLNAGKWNACLDLKLEADREKLRALVEDADVFLQGYRPGVLDKYGFGEKDIIKMCEKRKRGIIYARENCYGWNGPWAHRSGWQQISDACCGVSMEFGRAMGNDEAVTPIFPNSDYCTGIAGFVGIVTALLQRAETGGSYTVDIALNYYSQWLVNSCGTYPDAVWDKLWTANGREVFRHYHNMLYLLPRAMRMMMTNSGAKLFKPEFFTTYEAKSIGKEIKIVAPVLQYPGGEVKPGYQVGTRTNGVDQAKWPKDLSVEIVA